MEEAPKGMVPGIYNIASVGSKPIYRTGIMIAQSYSQKTLQNHSSGSQTKFNTICNPIPLVMTNPYVIKDMIKQQKS